MTSGPAALRSALVGKLRPTIKRYRGRVDDVEVRNARRLVRALRNGPPDVVAFGESNWKFRSALDVDQRELGAMIDADLGASVSMHVCAGPGYYAETYMAYLRLLAIHGARPVVILPLWARMTTEGWGAHPSYRFRHALAAIDRIDATTPIHRIRMSAHTPTPEEFAAYSARRIVTWAGDHSVGELRSLVIDFQAHGLDERARRRFLYAYHHGERVDPDGSALRSVEELGRTVRAYDLPVVVFQTPVPDDEGVALWGDQFRERAAETFGWLNDAFRRGYGDEIEILETGLAFDRSEFIDPADGSEHLNEIGRRHMAGLITPVVREKLAARVRQH